MPTFRERIANILLRPELEKTTNLNKALLEVWEKRPYWLGEDDLQEFDASTRGELVRSMGYLELGSVGTRGIVSDYERQQNVKLSRASYTWDGFTSFSIRLWTNYGFGQKVGVLVEEIGEDGEPIQEGENAASAVFQEFWNATRNNAVLGDRNIHAQSDRFLVDGEFFFVVFTDPMGISTVRVIKTDEIDDLITDPDDSETVLYYRRVFTPKGDMHEKTIYYRDWRADDKAVGRAKIPAGAVIAGGDASKYSSVLAMQIKVPGLQDRGLPLMMASFPWTRAYKQFLQDRLTIARMVAIWAHEVETKAGSRGIAKVQNYLKSALTDSSASYPDTNPPATAGSPLVHNDAISYKRQPMTTGAGDAQHDGSMFLAALGLGPGIYPHYYGMGQYYRLATATAMEGPMKRQWARYQMLWASVWEDLAKLVLQQYARNKGIEYGEIHVEVAVDALTDLNLEEFASAMAQLAPYIPDPEIVQRLVLQAFNVRDVDSIIQSKDEDTNAELDAQSKKVLYDLFREMGENPELKESAGIALEILGSL